MNIEIECTPIEARQFFGLPNVEPMQAAVMWQLEKRMLAETERYSPEALMKNWLAVGPQGVEQIQDFFRGIFSPPRTTKDQTAVSVTARLRISDRFAGERRFCVSASTTVRARYLAAVADASGETTEWRPGSC